MCLSMKKQGMVVATYRGSEESTHRMGIKRTDNSVSSSILIPAHFGNYKTIRKIGNGAVGSVYLAENEITKEKVAIKSLHRNLAKERDSRIRFRDEFELLHDELSHPNILKALEFSVGEESVPYIVFEYLDGNPLNIYMNYFSPMDISRIIRIAVQISSALQEIHDKEIIHRDIKPENVFILPDSDRKERVKLIDFGYSKKTGNNWRSGRAITQEDSNIIVGTPSYMAPELFDGKGFDRTVDFYALGVVIYKMIAKRVPFYTENPQGICEIVEKHKKITPPSLSEILLNHKYNDGYLDPFSAEYLNNTVQCLLAKKPSDRFQSGREIINHLGLVFKIDE